MTHHEGIRQIVLERVVVSVHHTGVGGVNVLVDQCHVLSPFDCEFLVHECRS